MKNLTEKIEVFEIIGIDSIDELNVVQKEEYSYVVISEPMGYVSREILVVVENFRGDVLQAALEIYAETTYDETLDECEQKSNQLMRDCIKEVSLCDVERYVPNKEFFEDNGTKRTVYGINKQWKEIEVTVTSLNRKDEKETEVFNYYIQLFPNDYSNSLNDYFGIIAKELNLDIRDYLEISIKRV